MKKPWEGVPSLGPDRENAKDRGGGPASVRNVLSGSGAGSITFGGGDLGFFGGDVQEDGGSARGIIHTGDRAKLQVE